MAKTMATTYVLRAGYPSVFSKSEMNEKLASIVDAIQDNPQVIVDEVIRLELGGDMELLTNYAANYRKPVADLTLAVSDDEYGNPEYTQMASGGGESRDTKESLRRAFCRLVIDGMHKNRMGVTMIER